VTDGQQTDEQTDRIVMAKTQMAKKAVAAFAHKKKIYAYALHRLSANAYFLSQLLFKH